MTTGELSWWASDSDPLLFDIVDTSVEATALAVQALARRNPRSPLLDRAVRWLMLNRSGGYWGTTKQTAMALYGLLGVHAGARRDGRSRSRSMSTSTARWPAGRPFTAASLTAPDPVMSDARPPAPAPTRCGW